jgi:hypothetical protein
MAKQTAAQKKAAFNNTAKKHAKNWNDGRESKPGESSKPQIDDGTYSCVVTGDYGVGDRGKQKGHPIITLTATVAEGDFEGVVFSQRYDMSLDWAGGAVARDLKCIMPDRADDISGAEMEELTGIIDDLNNDPPTMEVEASNSADGKYVNAKFPIPSQDGDSNSDPEPEAEGGDGGGDDPEPEAEAGDDHVWAKDDKVTFPYRGKDLPGVIVTVNKAEETARVKADKDKKVYPVGWDKLTLVKAAS